jgi:hypothetical protein
MVLSTTNRPQIQACRAGSLQNGIEKGVIVVTQPLVVITEARVRCRSRFEGFIEAFGLLALCVEL